MALSADQTLRQGMQTDVTVARLGVQDIQDRIDNLNNEAFAEQSKLKSAENMIDLLKDPIPGVHPFKNIKRLAGLALAKSDAKKAKKAIKRLKVKKRILEVEKALTERRANKMQEKVESKGTVGITVGGTDLQLPIKNGVVDLRQLEALISADVAMSPPRDLNTSNAYKALSSVIARFPASATGLSKTTQTILAGAEYTGPGAGTVALPDGSGTRKINLLDIYMTNAKDGFNDAQRMGRTTQTQCAERFRNFDNATNQKYDVSGFDAYKNINNPYRQFQGQQPLFS